jgi:hypothetical protein
MYPKLSSSSLQNGLPLFLCRSPELQHSMSTLLLRGLDQDRLKLVEKDSLPFQHAERYSRCWSESDSSDQLIPVPNELSVPQSTRHWQAWLNDSSPSLQAVYV